MSRAPTISREALAVTKTLAGFGFWPLVAAKCVSRARLGAIWLPLRETRALQAIRREFNLQTHRTTGAERFNNSAVCTFYSALEIWPVFAGLFRDLRREPGYGSVVSTVISSVRPTKGRAFVHALSQLNTKRFSVLSRIYANVRCREQGGRRRSGCVSGRL